MDDNSNQKYPVMPVYLTSVDSRGICTIKWYEKTWNTLEPPGLSSGRNKLIRFEKYWTDVGEAKRTGTKLLKSKSDDEKAELQKRLDELWSEQSGVPFTYFVPMHLPAEAYYNKTLPASPPKGEELRLNMEWFRDTLVPRLNELGISNLNRRNERK